MAEIKVNSNVWNAISDNQKQEIVAHLQQHGVLKAGYQIVPDTNTPPPNSGSVLYSASIGDAATIQALGIGDWVCKAACDAAAAAAVAALTLSGPALAAALAAIAAAREACRNACG